MQNNEIVEKINSLKLNIDKNINNATGQLNTIPIDSDLNNFLQQSFDSVIESFNDILDLIKEISI